MTESVGYYRNRLVEEVTARVKAEKERDELRAHVERLRDAIERYNIEQINLYGDDPTDLATAYEETPAQSLQALREEEKRSIKAEVEEEVITGVLANLEAKWNEYKQQDPEAYESGLLDGEDVYLSCMIEIGKTPRKYKGE